MEKGREWFGTPAAAVKSLIWLCWVSLLASVIVASLYGAVVGLLALVA